MSPFEKNTEEETKETYLKKMVKIRSNIFLIAQWKKTLIRSQFLPQFLKQYQETGRAGAS